MYRRVFAGNRRNRRNTIAPVFNHGTRSTAIAEYLLRSRIDGLPHLVDQFVDLRVVDHERRGDDQPPVRRAHDGAQFEADSPAMQGQLGFVAKALARGLVLRELITATAPTPSISPING